jgi:membrane-bound serine protease (ClpP class)
MLKRTNGRRLIKLTIAATVLGFGSAAGLETEPPVRSVAVITLNGVINPVSANYIDDAVKKALADKRTAILIEMDTPGGLLDATRSLITTMINAECPVIVYVSPRGGRATSAGVFITMASDVAAMAPETHIGAAHPVNIGGNETKSSSGTVMSEKMLSDAAAYMRTLTTRHNRNAEWAEKAVRESVSLTAGEALKLNVIEYVAESREDLFKALEGRVVKKGSQTWTLRFQNAAFVHYEMTPVQRVLQKIAHPNIAYILMTIGVYGLIYELAAPGIGLGGVAGIISLLLAFFALQILPINTVGIVLIVVGLLMLALELIAPSHGLLMFAGLISFALGSFFLIDIDSMPGYSRVSLELIGGTVLATALFFGIGLRKALQARRAKPKTGVEGLVGMNGVANETLAPTGMVVVNGELWNARADETIPAGTPVTVVRIEGNQIFVRKH